MKALREAVVGLLGLVLSLASFAFVTGTSMGVVGEHCLDVDASVASQQVDVDTHWTYIFWPPFTLANLDPTGRCVRNSPLREGLDAVGVWSLERPEEQVREHVVQQLEDEAERREGP